MKGIICFDLKLKVFIRSVKDVFSLSPDKLKFPPMIRGRFTAIVLELMLVKLQCNRRKLQTLFQNFNFIFNQIIVTVSKKLQIRYMLL